MTDLSGYSATLLPVRTVGVQGDGRTYNHVAMVTSSCEPDWQVLMLLARTIPRICHNVNRVVYAWGEPVEGAVRGCTVTHLEPTVLHQLQKVWVVEHCLFANLI